MLRFAVIIMAAFLGADHARAALPVPDQPADSSGTAAVFEGVPRVVAHLVVESETIQPRQPLRVGILFEVAEGWHVYWRNPGDSALPTRIIWQVEDARFGEIRWPFPQVFREPGTGFTTFGYEEQVLLSQSIRINARLDGPVELAANVRFLVCAEVCIPGRVDLRRTVVLGAPPAPDAKASALFDHYQARVPAPHDGSARIVEARYSQDAMRPGDSFLVGIGVRACKNVRDCDLDALRSLDPSELFLPYDQHNPRLRPLGVQRFPDQQDGTLIALRGHIAPDAPTRTAEPLQGLLAIPGSGYVEVSLPFPTAPAPAEITRIDTSWLDPRVTEHSTQIAISLAYAFGLALLGGLILNLMPCVLPVLAIKLVGLSELVHEERKRATALGFAYALGIQASMGILTAGVLLLRQAGVAVGWGFQFQEPVFLAAITVLVVLFACNLFGWFEIGTNIGRLDALGRRGSDLQRSFFDGFLAVALATPCSAPFLGTAVGFAFAGGPGEIATIFAAIGLGLALPFLAAALAPGLARWIPAPGPWMVKLRTVLGLALLATSGWLLWVLDRTAGDAAQRGLLVVLALVALGALGFGRLQRNRPGEPQRLAGLCAAGAIVLAIALLPLEPKRTDANNTVKSAIPWQEFDPAAITTTLRDGKPVFVYFTADWCISCKVNEQLVLEHADVVEAFADFGVVTFRGDWTLRDETIRAELARHGKAGVPVYLVYDPSRPERPQLLPELITVDVMLKALERASRASAG